MADKVTVMLLKVDLQCPRCFRKVKKIFCKIPQIRDQEYDEKQDLVKITVVCCDPEKIRDKLCCKGGKVIKSIEIVEPEEPEKPKQPKKPKKDEAKKEDAKKEEPPPHEARPSTSKEPKRPNGTTDETTVVSAEPVK